ncbi:hypothetical protein RN333_14430 [Enterobacter kobei]|uniref:hypothetical protein n=1 Tax=Enterobacter kobei TaxID=208224 RepID=UPI0013ED5C8C|nr:hypothetical protein [Enterobacter kobei]WNP33301.1 hypothetical protein RN333_14430 [Enterobacter kobei]
MNAIFGARRVAHYPACGIKRCAIQVIPKKISDLTFVKRCHESFVAVNDTFFTGIAFIQVIDIK